MSQKHFITKCFVLLSLFSLLGSAHAKRILLCAAMQHTILGKSKGLIAFLLSLSHNGTFCNDPTFRHSVATELEDVYRFDLADDYVDQSRGRVHLIEEQINTLLDMLKLEIVRFYKIDELELSEPWRSAWFHCPTVPTGL